MGSKDGAVEGIIKTFQETSSYVPFPLAVSHKANCHGSLQIVAVQAAAVAVIADK